MAIRSSLGLVVRRHVALLQATRLRRLARLWSFLLVPVACGGGDDTTAGGGTAAGTGVPSAGAAGKVGTVGAAGAAGSATGGTSSAGGGGAAGGSDGSTGGAGAAVGPTGSSGSGAKGGQSGAGGGCTPNGSKGSAAQCCSKLSDQLGHCCTGKGCCGSSNHSHASNGECFCDEGYAWASADETDLRCVLDASAPHEIDCAYGGHELGYSSAFCECAPQDKNTGSPVVTGTCHPDPQQVKNTACCAQSGYPGTGSCVCTFRNGPYKCVSFGATSCSCGYLLTALDGEKQCDNLPGPDGKPWRCCASTKLLSCDCAAGKAACGPDEFEVSDCISPAALGFKTPAPGCLPGYKEVDSCDQKAVPACTSDSQCGGSCTGTDPFCCPSCSNGKCQTCCATSSGSVSCF